jgi:muconolactone D-isomerase
MLYHADFHIEYPASMSQKDFFSIWAREAEAALGAKKAGVVIDIWKCVGSRRVLAVVNVDSPDTLDQILFDLPIMKEHGQHVQVDVTPLRRFEDFAIDVKSDSSNGLFEQGCQVGGRERQVQQSPTVLGALRRPTTACSERRAD